MYDVALIDIRMPKMNGFELYNEIRKKDSNVRVCFITAFEISKDESGKPSADGLVDFIRKPVDMEESLIGCILSCRLKMIPRYNANLTSEIIVLS